MQEFNVVKSADAQVQHDIANWENKADDSRISHKLKKIGVRIG